jgi:O-acetyl-ADP-ribose deacetylase (regulator of RNase III)
MQVIQDNILNIQEGIICHQVNCKGVFGAGLALQIRDRYPQAYRHYIEVHNKSGLHLGRPFYGWVSDKIIIYHLPAQYAFGRTGQHTDYNALRECLEVVANRTIDLINMPIYIPYSIGCGLGGGKWEVVSQIIEETLPEAIIVKL